MKYTETNSRYKILFYYPKGNKDPEDYEYPKNDLKKAIERTKKLVNSYPLYDIKLFNVKETVEYEEVKIEI